MIEAPPLEAGAVHERLTWEFPAVPTTPVGAPGTDVGVTGVIVLEEAEYDPVPTLFTAAT